MRILAVFTAYNEIDYLPYTLAYYKHIEIDVFVLDNYSTDGTWEFLEKHNVPRRRVDTNNTFHLEKLQAARLEVLHEEKPDWVIYGDSDEYVVGSPYPLRKVIEVADKEGINVIRSPKVEMLYTGEKPEKKDPRERFFYFLFSNAEIGGETRMHKYDPSVLYEADKIHLENRNESSGYSFVVNFGATKGPKNREEVFARRKKAWEEGLDSRIGNHYRNFAEQKWIWNKEDVNQIKDFEPLKEFWEQNISPLSAYERI